MNNENNMIKKFIENLRQPKTVKNDGKRKKNQKQFRPIQITYTELDDPALPPPILEMSAKELKKDKKNKHKKEKEDKKRKKEKDEVVMEEPVNDIEFDMQFRGYKKDQVDDYIHALSKDYNAICEQYSEIELENEGLRQVLIALGFKD